MSTTQEGVNDPDQYDTDAYGNEMAHAVAEYCADPAGGQYEQHAPHIKMPRLGSPKS